MTISPTTTTTFLFTDIAGSTRLWAEHRDAMGAAIARHDALLRAAVEEHGGTVFKTVGDAVCAAFADPIGAVAAAVAGQLALSAEPWDGVPPLRVRMAIHTGVAEQRDGDWFGQPVNRVARLLAVGHGGQVLVSRAAEELVAGQLSPNVTLRNLGEHRLRDLVRPEQVFQVLAPDLRSDFPPLDSINARSNNLPLLPHPILGREEELAALQALLDAVDKRLITITGPGGTGKTRLALQVAADVLERYPNGVFFVDLAPLTDPELVPSAIAATLGLVDSPGESILATLKIWLASRQLLLVLDNFEQLLPAAKVVGELLAACTRLEVLATSRAPLRLSWEHEVHLEPLPVPVDYGVDATTALSRYAAVQLFVDRAVAVRPDFVVAEENAPAVVEICARLDGLPLAIELAAARVRTLPPQAILDRLDQSLRLLAGGARDRPERQQTMRGAIDWSYGLLESGQQRLFRQLAVFAGGCSLAAVERVCAAEADSQAFVLDVLTALVEQSLVRATVDAMGEPRYSQLETLRAYGLEKLAEAGEMDPARSRHLAWCSELSDAAAAKLEGPSQPDWLDRLQRETDNLRAALDWSRRSGQPVLGLRIAANLSHFWYQRYQTSEARQVLDSLLRAAGNDAPSLVRAQAWRTLGVVCMHLGATAEAGPCFAAATAAAQELDSAELVRCLAQHTWQAWTAGDAAGAGDLWRHAVAHLGPSPRPWDRGLVAMTGCMVADVEGDLARAALQSRQSLADFRTAGDPYYTAIALNNYGWDRMLQGDPGAAVAALREGCDLAKAYDFIVPRANCLESLGRAAKEAGDLSLARRAVWESLTLSDQYGLYGNVADCLQHLAALEMAAGRAANAAALLGAQESVIAAQGRSLSAGEPATIRTELSETIDGNLGATYRAVAEARGRGLSIDEAVTLGLRIAEEKSDCDEHDA